MVFFVFTFFFCYYQVEKDRFDIFINIKYSFKKELVGVCTSV
jgi:hypothetical protein